MEDNMEFDTKFMVAMRLIAKRFYVITPLNLRVSRKEDTDLFIVSSYQADDPQEKVIEKWLLTLDEIAVIYESFWSKYGYASIYSRDCWEMVYRQAKEMNDKS